MSRGTHIFDGVTLLCGYMLYWVREGGPLETIGRRLRAGGSVVQSDSPLGPAGRRSSTATRYVALAI